MCVCVLMHMILLCKIVRLTPLSASSCPLVGFCTALLKEKGSSYDEVRKKMNGNRNQEESDLQLNSYKGF